MKKLIAALQAGFFAFSTPAISGPELTAYKLIFDDEFDGSTLDLSKWQVGTEPNGSQWGSNSYLVTSSVKDKELFPKVYKVANGVLTIQANYDAGFLDRQPWSRVWYSGMVSTAFSDGRAASALIRRGVVEVRQRLPSNKGAWPANWALNIKSMQAGGDPLGKVEVDGLEAYNEHPTTFSSGGIDWFNGKIRQSKISWAPAGPDLSADFHLYDYVVGDTTLTTYLDGVQVGQVPLFRHDTVDKFYWMFNNAEGGNGWPVEQPPTAKTTLEIDYVRIYSGDADAVSISPTR